MVNPAGGALGTYAAEEIVSRMEDVVDRMIQPSRHPKTRKEKLEGNGRIPKADTSTIRPIIDPWRNSESGSPEINTHSVPPVGDTPGYEITIDSDAPEGTNKGSQPTPEARMKKQAAEELKRSAGAELPGDNQFREVPHYGGSLQNPYITKKEHSPGNQSINPSIKERPRRSFSPKEKPPGGAFTPKTRKSIEKSTQGTARTAKATARKTVRTSAAKRAVERARRKAQVAAQRNMLQKTKQAAKVAAELSRKAAIVVTKSV